MANVRKVINELRLIPVIRCVAMSKFPDSLVLLFSFVSRDAVGASLIRLHEAGSADHC